MIALFGPWVAGLWAKVAGALAAVTAVGLAAFTVFERGRASAQQQDQLAALKQQEAAHAQVQAIETALDRPGAADPAQQLQQQFGRR